MFADGISLVKKRGRCAKVSCALICHLKPNVSLSQRDRILVSRLPSDVSFLSV